jgi:copper chaperone NosL
MKETRRVPGEGTRKALKTAMTTIIATMIVAVIAAVSLPVGPLGLPVPVAWAADKAGISPGPGDKCPVCGMLVAPFSNWVTAVVFKDGSRVFFDGPKDTFKYLSDPKKYDPSRQGDDVRAVWVTDYYRVSPVDGKAAWYVEGSDVKGPMGEEFVPFEKEADARAFLKDHKGKSVLPFGSVKVGTTSGREGHATHGHHE